MAISAGKSFLLTRGIAYYETGMTDLAIPDRRQACDLGSSRGCELLNSAMNEHADKGSESLTLCVPFFLGEEAWGPSLW